MKKREKNASPTTVAPWNKNTRKNAERDKNGCTEKGVVVPRVFEAKNGVPSRQDKIAAVHEGKKMAQRAWFLQKKRHRTEKMAVTPQKGHWHTAKLKKKWHAHSK